MPHVAVAQTFSKDSLDIANGALEARCHSALGYAELVCCLGRGQVSNVPHLVNFTVLVGQRIDYGMEQGEQFPFRSHDLGVLARVRD